MADLPARPDLGQLRRQAKDLLRAAQRGDTNAAQRIRAVSGRMILASAQLAVAHEYGFASWARLKTEVDRRQVLNDRDAAGLRALLAEQPELAATRMEHWCDHPKGASPLAYVAMLRFDARRLGLAGPLPGTGVIAKLLIEAGAPVDGEPGEQETPLITAASYGDAEVARVLIDAGADLEARAAADAGGVPGATALRHAAVFGMTEVVDVLVAAGARVHGVEEAAAAGDATGWLSADTPLHARIRALVMAADHQRLAVIDQLVQAGTPVDADDEVWGRQALRLAAQGGRVGSVRRLLERGADPNRRDVTRNWTALDWCRDAHQRIGDSLGHAQVEAILQPLTRS